VYVYIIPSFLSTKVHVMLFRCSISKMALESQLETEQNFHFMIVIDG